MTESTNAIIDLTLFKPRFGDRVPEGMYLVKVTDAKAGETKKGDPKITLWYDVVSGPEAGSVLVDTLTLTENAMFRAVNFMRAIGLPTPKKKLPINLNSWIGKRLAVVVADGEPWGDNNEVRSEVRSYGRASLVPTPAAAPVDDPWAGEGETASAGLEEFAEGTTSNPAFGTPESVPVAHAAPAAVQDAPAVSAVTAPSVIEGSERPSTIVQDNDPNQTAIENAQDFGTNDVINLDDIEGL